MKKLLLILVQGMFGIFIWAVISAAAGVSLFAICFVPIVGLLCGLELFGFHWSWGQASALSVIPLLLLFVLSEKDKNKRLEREEERERILLARRLRHLIRLWHLIRQGKIIFVISTSN
jgi:heme exporter protein D